VNDQAAWEQAITAARICYTGLPHQTAAQLNDLIDNIMLLKQKLVELATTAGSSQVCRECRGECCRYGKYHVTVLDLFAYLRCGTDQPQPNFGNHPDCPYADASGCIMAPGYRPMTCVVFNCQQIEERLSPSDVSLSYELEQKLREAIARASQISDMRLDRPLLLSGN
jgi:hypothetical protein